MNPGNLRNRIKIQSREESTDALGQPSKNWITVGATWAQVLEHKASEDEEADREQESMIVRFMVRYRKSFDVVTNDCRLIHKDQQYIIKTTYRDDNGFDKWLIIEAEHDTERTS